jgi:hypothetical protein
MYGGEGMFPFRVDDLAAISRSLLQHLKDRFHFSGGVIIHDVVQITVEFFLNLLEHVSILGDQSPVRLLPDFCQVAQTGLHCLELVKSQRIKHTVKRNNNFMCIKTETLKFLDLTNYIGPGFS